MIRSRKYSVHFIGQNLFWHVLATEESLKAEKNMFPGYAGKFSSSKLHFHFGTPLYLFNEKEDIKASSEEIIKLPKKSSAKEVNKSEVII